MLLRFLDIRKSTLQPRARALLVTELTGLERLLEATPTRSPDRPQLVRRLAEGYVELRVAASRDAGTLSGKQAELAEQVMVSASVQATAYYEKLLDAYPSYARRGEHFSQLVRELDPGSVA